MIERVSKAGPVALRVPVGGAPSAPAAPTFAPDARIALAPREPETRVAEPYGFSAKSGWLRRKWEKLKLVFEAAKTWWAPGAWVSRNSHGGKDGIRRIRERRVDELALPVTGGIKKADGAWSAQPVANPGAADGKFDPYAYLPNLAFSSREDSFPVAPDADRTGTTEDDLSTYEHGVIGGEQPLKGAVSVAKKGEYTVVTYAFFYVDNKAGSYHAKDSSTVAVYLKPGKDGKLEPEYMYSSWHYGASMTRWDDVKKGPDGRPVIRVERGSHALRPLARWELQPRSGVVVAGDGTVRIDGKPSPHRMTFVTPQGTSFRNAEAFEPAAPDQKLRMDSYYRIFQERTNPVLPQHFGL